MRLMQLGIGEDTTLRSRLSESFKFLGRKRGNGGGSGSGDELVARQGGAGPVLPRSGHRSDANDSSAGGIDIWRADGEDYYAAAAAANRNGNGSGVVKSYPVLGNGRPI